MRCTSWITALAGAFGLIGAEVGAQTAGQTVRFSVVPISRVSVSVAPTPLVVNTAVAGNAPTSARVARATWVISTNEANQKVVASIDQPMPNGLLLAVSLDAPTGAHSAGATSLGTASVDLVTGVSAVSSMSLAVVYSLSSTSQAAVAGGVRLVTFTITAGQ